MWACELSLLCVLDQCFEVVDWFEVGEFVGVHECVDCLNLVFGDVELVDAD